MPKASKGVLNKDHDDLDEDEDEPEEDDAEEAGEDDVEEEDAEEGDDDDTPPKTKVTKVAAGKRGRPKGSKSSGLGFGIVLYDGRPLKVDVVAVRGEIAKVRKPGSEDTPTKISSSIVRVYDEEGFDKLSARWDKIAALKDANLATHQKMQGFRKSDAPTRKRKSNPLEGLL